MADKVYPSMFVNGENTNTEGFKDWVPERDFVGYGFQSPRDCWPNNAKIAVTFALNYEEGAEHTVWNGDSRSVEFLHETHYHREPKEGKRDVVVESSWEYGIRAGLPRLLKLFKKFGWSVTIWTCGRSLEVSSLYGPILVENGHEIACHGNRWRGTNELSGFDEEADHVRKSFDRLQAATGRKDVPTGWYTGCGSTAVKHIRAKVHKERNVPLLYCSDSYSGDLPYYIESPLTLDGDEDEGMLMIPYTLVTNDHRFMVSGGTGTPVPKDWFEMLKSEFDMLYEEGLQGHPKMMTVAIHNRIAGKPGRTMALKRFMEYIQGKPDMWVTTRENIARHWRKEYPYEKVGPTRTMHC